jgi:hypothetical protein
VPAEPEPELDLELEDGEGAAHRTMSELPAPQPPLSEEEEPPTPAEPVLGDLDGDGAMSVAELAQADTAHTVLDGFSRPKTPDLLSKSKALFQDGVRSMVPEEAWPQLSEAAPAAAGGRLSRESGCTSLPSWGWETDDHGDGVRATARVEGLGWGLRLRGGGA